MWWISGTLITIIKLKNSKSSKKKKKAIEMSSSIFQIKQELSSIVVQGMMCHCMARRKRRQWIDQS